MTAPAPVILNFKPLDKNTLRAVFDIQLASGMTICGAMLHESHGKYCVGLPSEGYVKPDGSQGWSKVIDFNDKETGYRFQEIVVPLAIEALQKAAA
jgi:hypothetical protein